jgi:hypothetical protein
LIIDLEEKEESGTFDLKGGGKVSLRLMTDKDVREIRAACLSTAVEYPLLDGKYQRFEAEKFNGELFEEMRLDRNIVGWESLFDRNSKPIPVTKENKALLMAKSAAFREAVDAGLAALKATEKARTEQVEKN